MRPVAPGKVKPKRVKSPRIVHHHDRQKRWPWVLLVLLAFGAMVWQAYSWGIRQGGYEHDRSTREIASLKTALKEQQAQMHELEAEAIRHRRRAEIEQMASRELQQQLIDLENEKAAMHSEMEILRSLISSDNGTLYIKNFSLQHGDDGQGFDYRFTIVQLMEKIESTQGKLVMKLVGHVGKKKKRLDRSEFSPGEDKVQKLQFSNYKDVSGRIVLPEGFEPDSLLIEFLPRNKELKKISKSFSWSDYIK